MAHRHYRYTYREVDPIRSALKVFCDGEPPDYVVGNDTSGLTDEQNRELQEWVNTHLKDEIAWSTGIGAIEAAEHLVAAAVENANLPELVRCQGCQTPTVIDDLVLGLCESCRQGRR